MFRPNDHAAREKVLAELRRITHDQRIRIRARTVQCHIGLFQVSPLAEKPFSDIFGKPTIATNLGEEGVEVFSHAHHSVVYPLSAPSSAHERRPYQRLARAGHRFAGHKTPEQTRMDRPVEAGGFPYIVSSQNLETT